MSRRRKLTFTVSRTLLAGGLVATSALGGACDETDVTVNPAIDARADADAASDVESDTQETGVTSNPVPDFDTSEPEDWEVSVNPVPDFDTAEDDLDQSIEDEEWVSVNPCYDEDGDGYYGGGFCAAEDCDDFDPAVHPGAAEVCDQIDNDCDGLIDDDDPDLDGDDFCVPPMCIESGQFCTLGAQNTCCDPASSCLDIGQDAPMGQGVCCIPDQAPFTGAPGDGQACCNKDTDGDGLCGAAP